MPTEKGLPCQLKCFISRRFGRLGARWSRRAHKLRSLPRCPPRLLLGAGEPAGLLRCGRAAAAKPHHLGRALALEPSMGSPTSTRCTPQLLWAQELLWSASMSAMPALRGLAYLHASVLLEELEGS